MDSMLHDIAMEECVDLHHHGQYLKGGIDLPCLETVGKSTAIDSLAAIKHLIYDTKALTWDILLDALEANWEDHEAVRQMCLSAPKYGNGIEWVDAIGWEIERIQLKYARKHPIGPHQYFKVRSVPVTTHVPLGRAAWATHWIRVFYRIEVRANWSVARYKVHVVLRV